MQKISRSWKPLKFGSAIKSSDRDLWIKCDKEEWERLFNECVFTPIFYNEIPKTERKNIAYYNRQIKEKLKKLMAQNILKEESEVLVVATQQILRVQNHQILQNILL